KRRLAGADIGMQLISIGAMIRTSIEAIRWSLRLWRGPICKATAVPPASRFPVVRARPDEVERKRPTAIPPDSRLVDSRKVAHPAGARSMALPVPAGAS